MGKDGKEQILRFSKPGDIICYRSLLNQETTIRTLAKMEKEGYLELNKKEIRIPDFKKLMSGTILFD